MKTRTRMTAILLLFVVIFAVIPSNAKEFRQTGKSWENYIREILPSYLNVEQVDDEWIWVSQEVIIRDYTTNNRKAYSMDYLVEHLTGLVERTLLVDLQLIIFPDNSIKRMFRNY